MGISRNAVNSENFLLSIIIPFTGQDPLTIELASQLSALDPANVQVVWVLNSREDMRSSLDQCSFINRPHSLLLWEPQPGAGHARNLGLSAASGAILCLT